MPDFDSDNTSVIISDFEAYFEYVSEFGGLKQIRCVELADCKFVLDSGGVPCSQFASASGAGPYSDPYFEQNNRTRAGGAFFRRVLAVFGLRTFKLTLASVNGPNFDPDSTYVVEYDSGPDLYDLVTIQQQIRAASVPIEDPLMSAVSQSAYNPSKPCKCGNNLSLHNHMVYIPKNSQKLELPNALSFIQIGLVTNELLTKY